MVEAKSSPTYFHSDRQRSRNMHECWEMQRALRNAIALTSVHGECKAQWVYACTLPHGDDVWEMCIGKVSLRLDPHAIRPKAVSFAFCPLF